MVVAYTHDGFMMMAYYGFMPGTTTTYVTVSFNTKMIRIQLQCSSTSPVTTTWWPSPATEN